MINEQVYLLGTPCANEVTRNEQLQTALNHTSVSVVRMKFVPLDARRTESGTVVEQAYIYASTVRPLEQDRLVAAVVFPVGLSTEVFEATYILHLGYTHTRSTVRRLVRTELRDGVCHIVYLMRVLERSPLHTTIWQVFVVILALVMNGIKEVLEVVESNTAHIHFVLCRKRGAA